MIFHPLVSTQDNGKGFYGDICKLFVTVCKSVCASVYVYYVYVYAISLICLYVCICYLCLCVFCLWVCVCEHIYKCFREFHKFGCVRVVDVSVWVSVHLYEVAGANLFLLFDWERRRCRCHTLWNNSAASNKRKISVEGQKSFNNMSVTFQKQTRWRFRGKLQILLKICFMCNDLCRGSTIFYKNSCSKFSFQFFFWE